jgi:Skp family chaperone for outer membrane proteins
MPRKDLETERALSTAWYAANREKILALEAAYQEKLTAFQAARRAANREKERAQGAAIWTENPVKVRVTAQELRKISPEKMRELLQRFDTGAYTTLAQLATEYGVSHSRISQIKAKHLRRKRLLEAPHALA